MPQASFDVTCCVTVNSFEVVTNGRTYRTWAVELRREARTTQLQTYDGPQAQALAEARARSLARKLSALLDAAEELLD